MSESDARDALPPASTIDALKGPRAELARVIPRRPRVRWSVGLALAIGFALLVIPSVTAERWIGAQLVAGAPAPITMRMPLFAGHDTAIGHVGGGGILIGRGTLPDRDTLATAYEIDAATPHGSVPYIAYLLLLVVLAALFTHHMRRSTYGRLLRVQLVSLAALVVTAIVVKVLMLTTSVSVLVIPVAIFAMVPTLALDRVVGLATGTLAALVVSLLVPFDAGVTVILLVQAGAAGLVIAERPKHWLRPTLTAGAAATVFTAATYPLMLYLTAGHLPLGELRDPLHSAWLATALGPALATVLAIPLVPLYQLLVGEITQGKLIALEDHQHPLLRQIATRSPGTWQHSLMMANMAEIAASAIGANGRLVRVGALFHDLGKSLQPKYFIENLEPGETSPHDQLPPEVSCDAIFAHVTEGIVSARKAGLHERVIDFMHMHHGNGVLEYFWGKTKEQGNPKGLSVEHFRYPGVPPQSRETAILSICDAVEAASRTLKSPTVQQIDNLVQRIVYGKLHLGQLDESGLSMGDLRRIAESLRETIRHANHNRIEYPWQKAQQDASSSPNPEKLTQTGPRLDSLDRPAKPDSVAAAAPSAPTRDTGELAMKTTAPQRPSDAGRRTADEDGETTKYPKENIDEVVELRASKPVVPVEPEASSTNPVMQPAPSTSSEVIEFANVAREALEEAARDLSKDSPVVSRQIIAERSVDAAPSIETAETAEPAVARKRAATLPPIKPPTTPPPLGRRSPTIPPIAGNRLPGAPSTPPNTTIAPSSELRPPAPAQVSLPGVTAPPPVAVRPPGINYLDDMITLRPQYEPKHGLEITKTDDGSVRIEPRNRRNEDAVVTRPRMNVEDTTGADPGVTSPGIPSLAARLEARIDAQLDDDFGRPTPVSAPTRAELQALLNAPPDVTRQQSIEEIEALHHAEIDETRRAPYPTTEVDDADIEAAIELAPPARRTVIGVAKKPTKE